MPYANSLLKPSLL